MSIFGQEDLLQVEPTLTKRLLPSLLYDSKWQNERKRKKERLMVWPRSVMFYHDIRAGVCGALLLLLLLPGFPANLSNAWGGRITWESKKKSLSDIEYVWAMDLCIKGIDNQIFANVTCIKEQRCLLRWTYKVPKALDAQDVRKVRQGKVAKIFSICSTRNTIHI